MLDIPAAAAFMAESGVCAGRLPKERAACLAEKCACWTKAEKLLTLAKATELAAEVRHWREREERRDDDIF